MRESRWWRPNIYTSFVFCNRGSWRNRSNDMLGCWGVDEGRHGCELERVSKRREHTDWSSARDFCSPEKMVHGSRMVVAERDDRIQGHTGSQQTWLPERRESPSPAHRVCSVLFHPPREGKRNYIPPFRLEGDSGVKI